VQREKQDSRFLQAFNGVAWRRALVPKGYYFSFDAAENGKWSEPLFQKVRIKRLMDDTMMMVMTAGVKWGGR